MRKSKDIVENRTNNKNTPPQQLMNNQTEDNASITENSVPTVEYKGEESSAKESDIIFTTAEIIDFSEGADSYN